MQIEYKKNDCRSGGVERCDKIKRRVKCYRYKEVFLVESIVYSSENYHGKGYMPG